MYSSLEISSVQEQIENLGALAQWLNPTYAQRLLESGAVPWVHDSEYEYCGVVAVPKVTHFGTFQIPASNEMWGNKVKVPLCTTIRGLGRGVHADFNSEHFTLNTETRAAFERMKKVQESVHEGFDRNRLRIFQVRITTEDEPELREGEFFLDLASHLWLLIAHRSQGFHTDGTLLFRCRGESHRGNDIVVGYERRQRIIDDEVHRYRDITLPTIIGYVPY